MPRAIGGGVERFCPHEAKFTLRLQVWLTLRRSQYTRLGPCAASPCISYELRFCRSVQFLDTSYFSLSRRSSALHIDAGCCLQCQRHSRRICWHWDRADIWIHKNRVSGCKPRTGTHGPLCGETCCWPVVSATASRASKAASNTLLEGLATSGSECENLA